MASMSGAEVIWRDSDRWRRLTAEAEAAGGVSVVSRSGTLRLIDYQRRRHARVPLEGGHIMGFDSQWLPLGSVELTPCGIVLEERSYWARGTPVRLVLAGLVPAWIDAPAGRATVDAVLAGRPPTSPGHPSEPCGAFYCSKRGLKPMLVGL